MTANPDAVRQDVERYYSERAREESGPCCDSESSGSTCCNSYPVELLEGVPADAAGMSLGCADPVSAAGLQAGETVLDLGSGGGLDCFLAAREVGPQGRVIGVDMTDAMLERAEANRARAGAANVEFRKGLIEALPVADAGVDVVISNCVINLAPDKAPVLREIARVLKPGGRLAVADIVTRGPILSELRKLVDSWAACVAGALTVEAYIRGLTEAGFEDVRARPADGRDEEQIAEGLPFSALITARKPV
ncbi:MAG TPA: arsenite methyltransferase [Anaerolineales bacterium]|nr:arsenite methyltransferase [Anaerolineales bacterium]